MLVNKVKSPNLPLSSQAYSQQHFNQLNNVLRLYFNLIDQYLVSVNDAANGGVTTGGFSFPHIAASDSTDQIATGDNTPTVVNWNTLDSGYLWTLNAPGSATAQVGGVYKITYSLQFVNTANSIHYADVWLKVNNVDLVNSTSRFTLAGRKSASEFTFNLGYSEVTFEVEAGDEIELYWATDLAGNPTTPTDGVYIFHDTAQTVPYARPAIPSAIGSIVWLSAIT